MGWPEPSSGCAETAFARSKPRSVIRPTTGSISVGDPPHSERLLRRSFHRIPSFSTRDPSVNSSLDAREIGSDIERRNRNRAESVFHLRRQIADGLAVRLHKSNQSLRPRSVHRHQSGHCGRVVPSQLVGVGDNRIRDLRWRTRAGTDAPSKEKIREPCSSGTASGNPGVK